LLWLLAEKDGKEKKFENEVKQRRKAKEEENKEN
jgi:hypothetical protein